MAGAPLLLLVALFSAESAFSPAARRAASVLFLACGLGLRLLALGAIDGCKKQVLVTWGPYRYVRHPLYCGSLLALMAFAAHIGSVATAIAGTGLFLALYLPAIRTEELFLACRFADQWDSHQARTWALLPRPNRGGSDAARPFSLRRPWREMLVLVFLATVILGSAELVLELRQQQDLPDLFF